MNKKIFGILSLICVENFVLTKNYAIANNRHFNNVISNAFFKISLKKYHLKRNAKKETVLNLDELLDMEKAR